MNERLGDSSAYENRLVAILAIVGGIAAVDMLAFNFLAPFIATQMRLTNGQIGLIGGTGLITWAFGALTSALLSDRIGRRLPFLVGALICFALFSTASAFADSFATLIAARLLVGLSEGPVLPAQNAIMQAESSLHRRGLNLGIVQNFGAHLIGGIAGPLVLVAIASHFGWRDAFLVAAAPALLMAAVVRLCVREPARAEAKPLRLPPLAIIRSLLAVRNIRLCLLIGTCALGWLATTTVFIPVWMVRQLHFAPGAMSVAMACLGLGGAVASIVVPALSDRFGRRPVLVAFALTGLATPIGMLIGPASLALICGTLFIGSLFTGILPIFIGIVPMESTDSRNAATALAIVMGGAQITGSLVGPLLGGALADRFAPSAPFWLSIVLALCTALIGLRLTETAPARLARQAASAG